MKVFGNIITTFLLLLLLLFLFTNPSTAAIKSIKIQSDNRSIILLRKFGFTHHGNLFVSISNLSVTDPTSVYDPSLTGFVLLSDETLTELLFDHQHNPGFCILSYYFEPISLLFTLKDPSNPRSPFHISHWYPVTISNVYALFYVNCNPLSVVTMDVHTEMYNIDDGTTKDYLSAGLSQLPSLYFIFSLIYLCFLGFWIYVCFTNKRSVNRVHLLMLVLLTMKVLSLLCAAEDNYYVKVTGTSHAWNVLNYVFQFISEVVLFTVIVLIGAGLCYLKPSLRARETIVLMIVITLRVLANVASMVMDETGPFNKDWMTWKQVYMWADSIGCGVIILPVGWSVRSLTEISKTDEKSARNLTLFTRFYYLVVYYVLFTRVVVLALMDVAIYEYQWMPNAAEEAAGLVLYLVMFYMFRPDEKSEYVVLEDEEAATMAKG